MIHQVTLSQHLGGNTWYTTEGEQVDAMGNMNFRVGQAVWTDGMVIYGYNKNGYVPVTLKRKKKATMYVLRNMVIGTSNTEIHYMDANKQGYQYNNLIITKPAVICTDSAYFAGSTLYSIVKNSVGSRRNYTVTKVLKNQSLTVTTGTSPSYADGGVMDIGRNGGVCFYLYNASGTGRVSDMLISYCRPDMQNVTNITFNDMVALIQQKTGATRVWLYGCKYFNVDDEGELTAEVRAELNLSGTQESYTLHVAANGSIDLSYHEAPRMGDGVLNTSNNTLEWKNAEDTTISFSVRDTYEGRLTITDKYAFVYSSDFSDERVYQYDLSGNFIASRSDGVVLDNRNSRLDTVDLNAAMAEWGF